MGIWYRKAAPHFKPSLALEKRDRITG